MLIKIEKQELEQRIKELDVHGEEFLTTFISMLEKFNNEYDDMSQMKVMGKAKELKSAINEL